MEHVALIAAVVALLTTGVAVAVWILLPIDQAGRSQTAAARYSIADFLCLFVALQIPLTIGRLLFRDAPKGAYLTAAVITSLFAVVLWYSCAKALSKAGIVAVGHRFVFMGVIAPLVYYGFFPQTWLAGAIAFRLFLSDERAGPELGVWSYVSFVALTVAFFLSGVYVRWVLAEAEWTDSTGS